MTRAELISNIKYNLAFNADVFLTDEDARMVIKALENEQLAKWLKEKDEPKAVRYESDGYEDSTMVYDLAFCPNCGHEFVEDSENWVCDFCPNCGQRLGWGE